MYLATYGLLQALFVQQDAVQHLGEALGVPVDLKGIPPLREIRQARNESIGHPTKRQPLKSKPPSFHQISQISLGLDGFDLLSSYDDGRSEFKHIDTQKLIQVQRKHLRQALLKITKRLKRDLVLHKAKFKEKKLLNCFSPDWRYLVAKIREGTTKREGMHIDLALTSINSIKEMLESFVQALADRDINLDTYGSVKFHFEESKYVIDKLEVFFLSVQTDKETRIDPHAATIFSSYLNEQLTHLTDIAREIDQEYSSGI